MSGLPSLNGLRAFEAAARHLSFTRAALELHVTQAAVSHQIVRLEQQLGLRLFVRRNRTLALTNEAQAYLPAVQEAFAGLRRATLRLNQGKGSGILTVTCMTSFAAAWLVPRLGTFQERHPEIEVRLTTSFTKVDFRREDVDMGIRLGEGVWDGLRADWLMGEEIFPVCAPSLLAGAEPLRGPADLARHTLLHIAQWPRGWADWLAAAGAPGLEAARNQRFDLHLTAFQMAMQGGGVALGVSPLVDADMAAGRLVMPFGPRLPVNYAYYAVVPEENADQPKIRAFRDWLLEEAAAGAALADPALADNGSAMRLKRPDGRGNMTGE